MIPVQLAIEMLGAALAGDKDFATLAALARTSRVFRDTLRPVLAAAEAERYTPERGCKVWRKERYQLHRGNNLPAVIYADGTREWYRAGKRHRDGDLPAIIQDDGTQEWYRDGKRHRDGGLPTVIEADGSQWWHRDGKQHRDGDQPAVIWADGGHEWWRDGERVR